MSAAEAVTEHARREEGGEGVQADRWFAVAREVGGRGSCRYRHRGVFVSELSVEIRPMEPAEAPRVAALHRAGIPQGFLSRLNPGVRTELYRGIAQTPRSGVWVAASQDIGVVGFIAGTAHVGRCYREILLHRGLRMGLFMIPDLVRVATWRHVWETLLYPKREITEARRREGRNEAEPTAELLAIVVAPEARGSGAAGRLVDTLESALASWRCRGPYRVVTMSADPQSNAFYVKVGFRRVRPFVHHGIAMNLYHKDLVVDGE